MKLIKRPSLRRKSSKGSKAKNTAHVQVENRFPVEEERQPGPEGWIGTCTDGLCTGDEQTTGLQAHVNRDVVRHYDYETKESLFDKSIHKKKFPLISAMKAKLKESKAKKSKARVVEQPHMEPEPAVQKNEDPGITYEQWETFMDTVAFPEKSAAYKSLMEYMAKLAEEKKDDNERIMYSDATSNNDRTVYTGTTSSNADSSASSSSSDSEATIETSKQRNSKLAPVVQNKSEPLITYEQWEKFMDNVAFPENSAAYKHVIDYMEKQKESMAEQKRIAGGRAPAEEEQIIFTETKTDDDEDEDSSMSSSSSWSESSETKEEDASTVRYFVATQEEQEREQPPPRQEKTTPPRQHKVSQEQPSIGPSSSFISYKQWENFMDTVAFPEHFVEKRYQDLKAGEAAKRETLAREENKSLPARVTYDKYDHEEEVDTRKPEDTPMLFTIQKWSRDETIGMGFVQIEEESGVFIGRVLKKSKEAGFRTGMKVLAINGTVCPTTPYETVNLLKNLNGRIEIIVQGVLANPQLGAKCMKDVVVGNVVIKDVAHGVQMFGSSDSEDSDESDESEDDETSYPSLNASVEWSQNSIVASKRGRSRCPKAKPVVKSRQVTMPAKTENTKKNPPTKTATQTFVTYKGKNESVGVSFIKSEDWPGIFVQNVAPMSKFANSGMNVGMKLAKINGAACPEDFDAAMDMILASNGKLEFLMSSEEDLIEKQNSQPSGLLHHNSLRLDG